MELDPTEVPSGWDDADYKHFSVCGSDTSETETDTDTDSCADSTTTETTISEQTITHVQLVDSCENNKPRKFNKKVKDMKGFEKNEYKKILVEEELLPE
jgi:hypothetical protein